ncbi:MAG: group 1 truncated hemoglobin [Rhodospirillaceae bacterium]
MATLFEKYGGFAKVSRIVSAFYDSVLDSPLLAPYFDGVDMRRIIDHQTKFIAQAMGGPAAYSNQELERVHRTLDVTDAAFDHMLTLLRETLEDFGVEEADVDAVCSEILARKPYIVIGH